MKLAGRFVFVFQWIAPVVLIVWVLMGRGLFGAPLGWYAAIGLFFAPFVLVAMYIPPVLVLFDRPARQAGRVRQAYEIASYVLWGLMVIMGIVMVDGGDDGNIGSALTVWTGMDTELGEMMLMPMLFVFTVALMAQFVIAIMGIVASRKVAAPTR